jgi:hypothetical protein
VVLSPAAATNLRAAMAKPDVGASTTPVPLTHGQFTQAVASAGSAEAGHAYWTGSSWVHPSSSQPLPPSFQRVLPPPRPSGPSLPSTGPGFTPSRFYGSTQVDAAGSSCSTPFANEPSVAQSSDNPENVVVAAQVYMNSSGACSDSLPWVFYSHDGGQHWAQQVMPGLTAGLAGGDVGVVYDPKDHVFVYSFLQFSRTTSTNSINVSSSTNGSSWFDFTTLDSNAGALDKDMLTVNQDPSSSNYGRVLVAWRDEDVGQDAFIDAYSDNGGGSWTGSSDSINIVPDCGNGVSPAFDANGDAMAAWWDCNGSYNIEEELSTDGGASWNQPSNTVISGNNPIATSEDPSACKLDAGGTGFRCDSFPSLAGDPNPSDAGGQAFFVVFANWDSTTQSSVTANVSQLHGLSTVNGGSAWNGGSCCSFDFMGFDDFGDKFFPWAAFAPNGRLNVGFSDREGSASTSNPNGSTFNEGQSEAGSLTSLRSDSYVAYTADGTLGNPGSDFIGDYDGVESQDDNFDTFPVWTDLRNGSPDVRTMDLCYSDCPTALGPESPIGVSHAGGSAFTDLYSYNTDPSFGGVGEDYWNAVGIRAGADGTSVDDDLGLWNGRYFNNRVALGDLSPPNNDYVLENGNHQASQPYFIDVHSFSTLGGSYTVEWSHGHIVLATSLGDSMGSGDVIRVYDTLDAPSTTYYVGLRPNSGNTSNYRVSLHLHGNGDFQGSNQDSATSGNTSPGSPAFASVNTGSSTSDYDAVVVQNNNGGSGSYTLYRDTAAPSGTISINSGATYTKSTSVSLGLSASNPTSGDPVMDMRFSNDGVTFGAWQAYSSSASYTMPAGDGTKTVYVQFRNGAGVISATASDSIILDTTPPSITSPPAPALKAGQVGTTNVRVGITWSATDATSGVATYSLKRSVNGGAFASVTLSNPALNSVVQSLTPGKRYHYEVSATDKAGNTSAFVTGTQFTLTAFKTSASAITYSGGWSTATLAGSYSGTVHFTTTFGKKATLAFTGSQVEWVSTLGATQGSAKVSLDGGAPVIVNTNAGTTRTRQAVFVASAASAAHTLVVTNKATSGHPRIDVDAFIVIS